MNSSVSVKLRYEKCLGIWGNANLQNLMSLMLNVMVFQYWFFDFFKSNHLHHAVSIRLKI